MLLCCATEQRQGLPQQESDICMQLLGLTLVHLLEEELVLTIFLKKYFGMAQFLVIIPIKGHEPLLYSLQ